MSKDPALVEQAGESAKPWHLGPVPALVIALALPISYGVWFYLKHRKLNFFSIVGLISVLLTGGLTLYLWQKDGSVRPSAPILFGIKEACIPLILGLAILISHWTKTPLLNTFIYSPHIFDIKKIEKMVKERGTMPVYGKLLFSSTFFFSASFLISTVANFFLAQYFLGDIDFADKAAAREQYNQGVGRLTGWGFVAIGLPILVILLYLLWRLVAGLRRLTGLQTEEILLPR
jgi:intracellular septation protein A